MNLSTLKREVVYLVEDELQKKGILSYDGYQDDIRELLTFFLDQRVDYNEIPKMIIEMFLNPPEVYFIKQDGTEMPGKGTAIGNPDTLAEALINNLYGNTKNIISSIATRDDYISSMGQYYAGFDDGCYEEFKDTLDSERSKAIIDRGMSSDEFMETLK